MDLPQKPLVASLFSKKDSKNNTPLGTLVCKNLNLKFCGDRRGGSIRWRCTKKFSHLDCPAKFYTDQSAIYLTSYDYMYSHKCTQSSQATELDSALKSARSQKMSAKRSKQNSSPQQIQMSIQADSPSLKQDDVVDSLLVQFNKAASEHLANLGFFSTANKILTKLNKILSPDKKIPSPQNEVSPFSIDEHQTTQKLQTNQSLNASLINSSSKKRLRNTMEDEQSPSLSKRLCTEQQIIIGSKSLHTGSSSVQEERLMGKNIPQVFVIQPQVCPLIESTVEMISKEIQTDSDPSQTVAPKKPPKQFNHEVFKYCFMDYTKRFTEILAYAVKDNFFMREIIKDELIRDDTVLSYLQTLFENSTLNNENFEYLKKFIEKLKHKSLAEFKSDLEEQCSTSVQIYFNFIDSTLQKDIDDLRAHFQKEGCQLTPFEEYVQYRYNKTFDLIVENPLPSLLRNYTRNE